MGDRMSIADLLIESALGEITFAGGDTGSADGFAGQGPRGGPPTDGGSPSRNTAVSDTEACPKCRKSGGLPLNATTRQCQNCNTVYGNGAVQPQSDSGSTGVHNRPLQQDARFSVPGGALSTNERNFMVVKYLGGQLFELSYNKSSSSHHTANAHTALQYRLADSGGLSRMSVPLVTEWLYAAQPGEMLHLDMSDGRALMVNADGTRFQYGERPL